MEFGIITIKETHTDRMTCNYYTLSVHNLLLRLTPDDFTRQEDSLQPETVYKLYFVLVKYFWFVLDIFTDFTLTNMPDNFTRDGESVGPEKVNVTCKIITQHNHLL